MDIKLVITNTVKKGVLFASNGFKLLTLEETILNAEKGDILGLSVVLSKYGKYLRAFPNHIESDNLDAKDEMNNLKRAYLFKYAVQPKHNIRFEAAHIKSIIDHWSNLLDLTTRPEIIGTLYSIGKGTPKTNPIASERGLQIASEFYDYAKKWLK